MNYTIKTVASAIVLSMVMGSGSALAKAHDQGVADGEIAFPDGTGAAVQTLDQGVSGGVANGVRGGAASADGGGNRVEPVVNAEPN